MNYVDSVCTIPSSNYFYMPRVGLNLSGAMRRSHLGSFEPEGDGDEESLRMTATIPKCRERAVQKQRSTLASAGRTGQDTEARSSVVKSLKQSLVSNRRADTFLHLVPLHTVVSISVFH